MRPNVFNFMIISWALLLSKKFNVPYYINLKNH